MGKPAIVAVDDDALVLSAVKRDLSSRYSDDYQILQATSGPEALDTLRELQAAGDPAALLLADQRMPGMTGVEFLSESRSVDPRARRVLLTAYADTNAAIDAINRAGVSHYVLKPWDPPEQRLFPVLDEELDTWRADYRPPFEGIRVLGDRWSAETHRLKEFLAHNQVPYLAVDAQGKEGQWLLQQWRFSPADLPIVLLQDGAVPLVRPTIAQLGTAVNLKSQPSLETYDLIIVGAGPAGLAAAVYGASEGLKVAAIEREAPGGQAGQSSRIENYLGFPAGVTGADLTRRALTQATRFQAEMLVPVEAVSLERNDPFRIVRFDDGSAASCRALLIASGVSYRMLDARGADRLLGAGIHYGTSPLEAAEYAGEDVIVVGAGNSAGQAALYLSESARSVTIVVRGQKLESSMSAYLVERVLNKENISVLYESEVAETAGETHLNQVVVKGPKGQVALPATGMFVFIGQQPRTDWLGEVVQRDAKGFILTGTDCTRGPEWTLPRLPYPLETNVPGVFAAGDVRAGSTKRVASAAGEGAMAVRFIHDHLETL